MKKNIFFLSILCLALFTSLFFAELSVSPKLISFADITQNEAVDSIDESLENHASIEDKTILVSGSATIKISPNTANVSIGVESCGETLSQVLEETNQKLADMIEFLETNNIEESCIKTQNFSIYQRYDSSSTEKSQIYCVNSMLEFSTKDLASIEDLISGLTDLGANRLNGISFTADDLSQYYNDALKQALENAESKASALVEGDLVAYFIKEDCTHSYMPLRTLSSFEQKSSIAPGVIEVSAKVLVKFKTVV